MPLMPPMPPIPQRIWLIRHAKSSRPFGVVDHQRPLAKRAAGDAALIRDWLAGAPALFVPSTARRALDTAALLAGDRPVAPRAELYQATVQDFVGIIEDTLASARQVAFVAHNPTVTQLVNQFAGRAVTDNVPTLGCAAFERSARHWTLVGYATPKRLG